LSGGGRQRRDEGREVLAIENNERVVFKNLRRLADYDLAVNILEYSRRRLFEDDQVIVGTLRWHDFGGAHDRPPRPRMATNRATCCEERRGPCARRRCSGALIGRPAMPPEACAAGRNSYRYIRGPAQSGRR